MITKKNKNLSQFMFPEIRIKSRNFDYLYATILISSTLIFLFVFLEWIFYVTKPSFLSTLSTYSKIEVLIFVSSLFIGISTLFFSILFLIILIKETNTTKKIFCFLSVLFFSLFTETLTIILIDNFTYSIFRFGIVSTSGITRVAYSLIFFGLIFFLYKEFNKIFRRIVDLIQRKNKSKSFIIAFILLVILSLAFTIIKNKNEITLFQVDQKISNRSPNILLITADGVDAKNTSLYGYDRNTTPNLLKIKNESLFAENAFTNSGNTAGSIISIYTSKYPTQVKVLYPPDILRNNDSYQHLVNTLRSNGYYSAQFTQFLFADAYTLNMLSGFDEANGRFIEQSSVYNKLNSYIKGEFSYFIYELANKASDRIKHLLFIKTMPDLSVLIKGIADEAWYNDKEKLEGVLNLFEEKEQPLFVHLHWMGTHGPKFYPEIQLFSLKKNLEDQTEWDVDFYDDSILEFDLVVGKIIHRLIELDKYENTILIIASDHGQKYITTQKIPLLIHFPNGEFNRIIENNVQNIDIAPTLLDYLQISQPDWMEGKSLLDPNFDKRPIFGVGVGNVRVEEGKVLEETVKPPFYQFGYMSIIDCNVWFKLNLANFDLNSGFVENHTNLCYEDINEVSDDYILGLIINRLEADGFDTSSIKKEKGINLK